MRRSTVLSLKKFNILSYLAKNRSLLVLTLFFIIGIIIGVVFLEKSDNTYNISHLLFNSYISSRLKNTFIYVFLKSFLSFLIACFIIFLTGTSFIGVVLSPAVVFVYGYLSGAFLGYIYLEYSIKGIAFNAVVIIPTVILFLIGFILSARESLNFSCELVKLTFNKSYATGNIFDYFKSYCGRYLFLLLLPLISAIVDGVFSVSVLKFFDF